MRRILRRRNFDSGGPRRNQGSGPRRMLLDVVRKLIEWRDFDTPWRYRDFDRDREIDGLLADLKALGDLRGCGKPDDWLTKALEEFDRFIYEMNRLEAVRGGRDYDALEAELLKLLTPRQNIWTWKGYGPLYGARNGEKIKRAMTFWIAGSASASGWSIFATRPEPSSRRCCATSCGRWWCATTNSSSAPANWISWTCC